MKNVNKFNEFLSEENEDKVNERWTIFEEHIWDHLKRVRSEIENLRRFESPKKAIKAIEMIEDYLKDIKADIKHKSSNKS